MKLPATLKKNLDKIFKPRDDFKLYDGGTGNSEDENDSFIQEKE